ncbi:MAG TPA: polyprenyl diphosphate synthase [Planctomycetaceae bacterium]|nr:polyprenyl diphosphate synthase [Planctomycetaceae bacterium]
MAATERYTFEEIAKRDLDPDRLPVHVAIIMDGNGRWAASRGMPRIEGHRQGADSVRAIIEESARLGFEQLTLYCLSSENWKRPKEELDLLLELFERYLIGERPEIMRQDLRFAVIGRSDGLTDAVRREIKTTEMMASANQGMRLCLAVNYGSRGEIADACQAIAKEVRAGKLDPEQIDEQTIANHLYTTGMPDPDLVIRTAGEMRVSNYLLWQISYSEFWVTPDCWPDFSIDHLHNALRDFAARDRRFGGIKTPR